MSLSILFSPPFEFACVTRDDFNRANSGTLGGSWVEGSWGFGTSLEINSNQVRVASALNEQTAHWTGINSTFLGICATLATLDSTDYAHFLGVRTVSGDLGYFCYLVPGFNLIEVWRADGGPIVLDGTIDISASYATGDQIGMVFQDRLGVVNIGVYKKTGSGAWTQIGLGAASVRVAGPYYPAIGIYQSTTARWDNFGAYDYLTSAGYLQDDFDDNSLDSSLWATLGSGTITETSQRINISVTGTAEAALLSQIQYNLVGSYVHARTNSLPSDQDSFIMASVQKDATPGDGDVYRFGRRKSDGALIAEVHTTGGSWTTIASGSFDATNHAWIRMRESGGTLYFETAPDSAGAPGTWTVFGSDTSLNFAVSLVYIGFYATRSSGTGVSTWDNFNTWTGVQPVSSSRQLKYDVVGRVSSTRQLKYDVSGKASSIRQLLYDVPTRVSATRQLKYDVAARISGTRQLKYDLVGRATSTRQLLYDVFAFTSSTRQLKYDIAARVSATRQLRYDVWLPGISTRQLRYDIFIGVSATRQLHYDVFARVSGTRELRYDLAARISTTCQLVYDIAALGMVSASCQLRYDVLNGVTSTRQLRYDVFSLVSSTVQLRYDVTVRISDTRQLVYDVASLSTASSTKQLQYDVHVFVSSTRQLCYDLSGRVFGTREIRYDIAARTSGTRQLLYDVCTGIAGELQLRYNLRSFVNATCQLRYEIEGRTSSTLELRYDIEPEAAPQTPGKSPIAWLIRVTVDTPVPIRN